MEDAVAAPGAPGDWELPRVSEHGDSEALEITPAGADELLVFSETLPLVGPVPPLRHVVVAVVPLEHVVDVWSGPTSASLTVKDRISQN